MTVVRVVLYALVAFGAIIGHAESDPLTDAMKIWRAYAPRCTGSEVSAFPSARAYGDGEGPENIDGCRLPSCGDGDANMLPNGMLCLAGEEEGCDAVRRAQDATGKWHRSPRLAKRPECRADDEFSRDMGLGVQAYLIRATKSPDPETRSVARAQGQAWWDWLSAHATCEFTTPLGCALPRVVFCEKPSPGESPEPKMAQLEQYWRCAFIPVPAGGDFAMLAQTERFVGLGATGIFRGPLGADLGWASQATQASALANKPGFSQHLVAVQIHLLREMGVNDDNLAKAAEHLAQVQNENPYFAFLHEGPTDRVKQLVLRYCPVREIDVLRHVGTISQNTTPSSSEESAWWKECETYPNRGPHDWFLQRAFDDKDDPKPWCHANLWDCIFMGRLLGAS